MTKDGLKKYYGRLTAKERFRLFVEATARGDEGECRNLGKSCPRLSYEMKDTAYVDRVGASEEITLAVCMDLAPRLATLSMSAAFLVVSIALRNAGVEEAYSAYFRGRVEGEKIRRTGDPKGRPPEPQKPDHGTGEALRDITVHMEGEWSVFAEPIGRLEEATRMEVATIWGAFSGFARTEIGVEPKTLIKAWFEPILPEIEAVEDSLGLEEKDPETLEEYGSMLRGLWSGLVP